MVCLLSFEYDILGQHFIETALGLNLKVCLGVNNIQGSS